MEEDGGQPCTHCGAFTLYENIAHFGEDADFCETCANEWQRTFADCVHDWATVDENGAPYMDEYGDLARYCHKCSGMNTIEDGE